MTTARAFVFSAMMVVAVALDAQMRLPHVHQDDNPAGAGMPERWFVVYSAAASNGRE